MSERNLTSDDDYEIGDLVVVMAEPGPFRVVGLEPGSVLLIESPTGSRRRVLNVAVRRVSSEPPVNR